MRRRKCGYDSVHVNETHAEAITLMRLVLDCRRTAYAVSNWVTRCVCTQSLP